MDTIKIDDKEYKFSDLSEDARAQLLSLQATDAKISELQRDMAICSNCSHGLCPCAQRVVASA